MRFFCTVTKTITACAGLRHAVTYRGLSAVLSPKASCHLEACNMCEQASEKKNKNMLIFDHNMDSISVAVNPFSFQSLVVSPTILQQFHRSVYILQRSMRFSLYRKN